MSAKTPNGVDNDTDAKISSLLFVTFGLLALLSIAATYHKHITLRDFTIIDDVSLEEGGG
jgi:hypothetical protein